MKRFLVGAAMVSLLLPVARPVSASPLELLLKCGSDTPFGPVVFVPPPAPAAGAEYTPQMALRPGLTGWRVENRSDIPLEPRVRRPAIYLLDGKIIEPDAFQQISAREIDSITITCSEAYHSQLGIEEGHPLIVAFSRGGSLELLRKEMRTIEAMQASFMEVNARFARSLDELGWKAADAAWAVELTVSEDGSTWKAIARHRLVGDRLTITAPVSR